MFTEPIQGGIRYGSKTSIQHSERRFKSKGIDSIEKLFEGKGKEELAEELTVLKTRVETILNQLDTNGQSTGQSHQTIDSSSIQVSKIWMNLLIQIRKV